MTMLYSRSTRTKVSKVKFKSFSLPQYFDYKIFDDKSIILYNLVTIKQKNTIVNNNSTTINNERNVIRIYNI